MPHKMYTRQHFLLYFFTTVFAYFYSALLLFLLHLLWLLCLYRLLLLLTRLNYQLALDFLFAFIWFMTTQSIYDLNKVFSRYPLCCCCWINFYFFNFFFVHNYYSALAGSTSCVWCNAGKIVRPIRCVGPNVHTNLRRAGVASEMRCCTHPGKRSTCCFFITFYWLVVNFIFFLFVASVLTIPVRSLGHSASLNSSLCFLIRCVFSLALCVVFIVVCG